MVCTPVRLGLLVFAKGMFRRCVYAGQPGPEQFEASFMIINSAYPWEYLDEEAN